MLSLGDKGSVLLGPSGDDPPDGFDTVMDFTEFWVMLRNRLLELVKHASFQVSPRRRATLLPHLGQQDVDCKDVGK